MIARYLVEILASGQPAPYADSRCHVRLTIEVFFAWSGDAKDPRSAWRAAAWCTEDKVRALLPHLACGFTENTEWKLGHRTLDWLREVAVGVWEFRTSEPYND
jgi:hypothetical protein